MLKEERPMAVLFLLCPSFAPFHVVEYKRMELHTVKSDIQGVNYDENTLFLVQPLP